jgi:hypothetical protein
MIQTKDKIKALAVVGNIIKKTGREELSLTAKWAKRHNNWFTEDTVLHRLNHIADSFLNIEKLEEYANKYNTSPKNVVVGIVLDARIPAEGIQDIIALVMSGYKCRVKLHEQDKYLTTYLLELFSEIEPDFKQLIFPSDQLKDVDALVATVNDKNEAYYNKYLADKKLLLRKEKRAVGIISNDYTVEEIQATGRDIFNYYGLARQNIGKLLVPENFNFQFFIEALDNFREVQKNHRYTNHYDYNKSLLLVNREHHYDSGFLVIRNNEEVISPIATLNYSVYNNEDEMYTMLATSSDHVSAVVSKKKLNTSIPVTTPGYSTVPKLWEFPAGENYIEVLNS